MTINSGFLFFSTAAWSLKLFFSFTWTLKFSSPSVSVLQRCWHLVYGLDRDNCSESQTPCSWWVWTFARWLKLYLVIQEGQTDLNFVTLWPNFDLPASAQLQILRNVKIKRRTSYIQQLTSAWFDIFLKKCIQTSGHVILTSFVLVSLWGHWAYIWLRPVSAFYLWQLRYIL